MEQELTFFPIPGCANYEISRCGITRHVENKVPLNISINDTGYPYVVMAVKSDTRKHGSSRFLLHRLVAITFIPNPENKRTVNHINGNKLDYSIPNLEWNTDKENINHAFDNDLNVYGEKHYQSKLSNDQVREIRAMAGKYKHREIAEMYGISQTTATNVINKKVYARI